MVLDALLDEHDIHSRHWGSPQSQLPHPGFLALALDGFLGASTRTGHHAQTSGVFVWKDGEIMASTCRRLLAPQTEPRGTTRPISEQERISARSVIISEATSNEASIHSSVLISFSTFRRLFGYGQRLLVHMFQRTRTSPCTLGVSTASLKSGY